MAQPLLHPGAAAPIPPAPALAVAAPVAAAAAAAPPAFADMAASCERAPLGSAAEGRAYMALTKPYMVEIMRALERLTSAEAVRPQQEAPQQSLADLRDQLSAIERELVSSRAAYEALRAKVDQLALLGQRAEGELDVSRFTAGSVLSSRATVLAHRVREATSLVAGFTSDPNLGPQQQARLEQAKRTLRQAWLESAALIVEQRTSSAEVATRYMADMQYALDDDSYVTEKKHFYKIDEQLLKTIREDVKPKKNEDAAASAQQPWKPNNRPPARPPQHQPQQGGYQGRGGYHGRGGFGGGRGDGAGPSRGGNYGGGYGGHRDQPY
jgi:hypothetical protein